MASTTKTKDAYEMQMGRIQSSRERGPNVEYQGEVEVGQKKSTVMDR